MHAPTRAGPVRAHPVHWSGPKPYGIWGAHGSSSRRLQPGHRMRMAAHTRGRTTNIVLPGGSAAVLRHGDLIHS